MQALIKQLQQHFPQLIYRAGSTFYWSPETKEISYNAKATQASAVWSLLHETGHALLEHTSYKADFELVRLEVAAWEKAKALASEFDITIDEDHIQDCLDTYRDWLYARSVCPKCNNKSLQQSDLHRYQCFNCHTVWQVTPSRFCRAYRATKHAPVATPAFYTANQL